MANTYKLIEAKTLSTAVSSITFSSIPATYTDLQLFLSVTNTAGIAASYISFNGSTSDFTNQYLYANPNATPVGGRLARYIGSQSNNCFASYSIYISNYVGSNYKSFIVDNIDESNIVSANLNMIANLWSNSAAINSIDIVAGSGNMGQYSTFYLYGISNA